jgi:hypothetical protein
MVDSRTLSGGSDFPLFGPKEAALQLGARAAERPNIDALREKVREIGVDLKRNWTEERSGDRSTESRPNLAAPREVLEPQVWAERLADEYCEDFAPGPPAIKSSALIEPKALVEPEEQHVWADRIYAGGRLLFVVAGVVGPVLAPVFVFLGARRGLVLQILLGGLLVLTVQGLLRDWPTSPAVAPAPRPAWLDIAKPYPLFELSAQSLIREKPVYTARRHSTGGGREDVLTFGDFGGKQAFLRLSIYRHGSEEASNAIYFVDMARRAGAAGLAVTQAELPRALPTRFGVFESAPLELAAAGLKRKNCRGFRLESTQPALSLGGLACGGGEQAFSAADTACLIDRLDLLAAGQDQALADFFGATQGKTGRGCVDGAKRK